MASQIDTLLQPPNVADSHTKATLFLNSHFKSLNDLGSLSIHVAEAKNHSDHLNAQLSTSTTTIQNLIADSKVSARSHLRTAQDLSLLRHSLNDELSHLSQTLISSASSGDSQPTLLEEIETLHRNLKELESVKGYVQVIEHTLKLSEAAISQAQGRSAAVTITKDSLSGYQALQTFVTKVSDACSIVEGTDGGNTLHLIDFLVKIRDKTWLDIKNAVFSVLLSAADALKWPMPVDYLSARPEERMTFEKSFLCALQLQTIGESMQSINTTAISEKDGLYPLQALAQPIALRFKYHFEGTRQTNRIDKPEWYFTHVLNVAHEHRPFMETVIQPLISSPHYKNITAWREFTRLMLPLVTRKLRATVPQMLHQPSLLAHTIYQSLTFDAALAEDSFELTGTSAVTKDDPNPAWEGVSAIILGRKEWFDAWVNGEKNFAEGQYQEIINASDAWQFSDDGTDSASTTDQMSTNSARRLRSLVEQITDRYSGLPQFTQRTQFLITVQLPLLERYHGRIASSLDAFETLSSTLVRAVPGALGVSLGGKDGISVNVETTRLASGVEGVQRLVKAWISAKYMETAMDGWGEELFFLELWTEINERASLRARAQAHSSLPNPVAHDTDEIIFHELVTQYRKLSTRADDIIVQQICGEIEGSLRPHLTASLTAHPVKGQEMDGIAISQTLLAPLGLLSTHLSFAQASLPPTAVTVLYRRIASRLSEHMLQRQILYRGNVTLSEGRIILGECDLWVGTCQDALRGALGGGRNRLEAPWGKFLQASRLIASEGDVWNKTVEATFSGKSDSEWNAAMVDIVGFSELDRDEVGRLLRRRQT